MPVPVIFQSLAWIAPGSSALSLLYRHPPLIMNDHVPYSFALRAIACVLALALSISTATAQEVIPPDAIDQTGQDEEDDDEAQTAFDTFDDLKVERVQPGEIPNFKPGLPQGAPSQMSASDLPRSLSGDQLRRVSEHVAASTLEIIAVTRPPSPYRSTEMVYRGHALWISPSQSGDDPVLISTADWLENADRIYAVDGDVSQALSRGGLELGGHSPQPLSDVMADKSELLERFRDDLVPLEVEQANRHVNLVRLSSSDKERISAPSQGLIVHNMDTVMPGAIFGYSPSVGSTVSGVGYEDSSDLEPEYSFYFLVTFGAILGAPIVTTEGHLLAISALRYPEDPDYSLAIPPGAIHAFLNTGRADGESDDER